MDALQREIQGLRAERDALRAQLESLIFQCERLDVSRGLAIAERDSLRAELVRLRAASLRETTTPHEAAEQDGTTPGTDPVSDELSALAAVTATRSHDRRHSKKRAWLSRQRREFLVKLLIGAMTCAFALLTAFKLARSLEDQQ
jgi:hypothetical protein